ncbi:hypothetical protein KC640_00040, partial [Candidatus Dojkabacteria bacterium]|nr:hypothetical protein [Candidatus Dojkabacteria bacterium]
MIEKIKQIKFTTVIIFLAVIIVILLILQALFSTSNQTRPGSELVVPGVDQTASFERYEATGTGSDLPVSPSNRVVIKIYVESIGDLTTPMFTALKREALAREGLTE